MASRNPNLPQKGGGNQSQHGKSKPINQYQTRIVYKKDIVIKNTFFDPRQEVLAPADVKSKATQYMLKVKESRDSLKNYACNRCSPSGELQLNFNKLRPPSYSCMTDLEKLQAVVELHIDQRKERAWNLLDASSDQRKWIIKKALKARLRIIKKNTSLGIMKFKVPSNLEEFKAFKARTYNFDYQMSQ